MLVVKNRNSPKVVKMKALLITLNHMPLPPEAATLNSLVYMLIPPIFIWGLFDWAVSLLACLFYRSRGTIHTVLHLAFSQTTSPGNTGT